MGAGSGTLSIVGGDDRVQGQWLRISISACIYISLGLNLHNIATLLVFSRGSVLSIIR